MKDDCIGSERGKTAIGEFHPLVGDFLFSLFDAPSRPGSSANRSPRALRYPWAQPLFDEVHTFLYKYFVKAQQRTLLGYRLDRQTDDHKAGAQIDDAGWLRTIRGTE